MQPLPPPGRKRKRPNKLRDEGVIDAWLMTYADMITLLLCFFVIFFAISNPSTDRIKEALQSMKQELKIKTGVLDKQEEPTEYREKVYPYKSIMSGFDSIIFLNRLQNMMTLESTEKGVIIELKNGALFDSGSAEISEGGKAVLMQLAETIRNSGFKDYVLVIEGHTDNVPVTGTTYASNWELSAMRAVRVVRYLTAQGIGAERMSAQAFADTRPKEPNRDMLGRPIPENQAVNRRTVIRMEKAVEP